MYQISEILNEVNLPLGGKNEIVSIFIDAEYVIQSFRAFKDKPRNQYIPINNIMWDNLISYLACGRPIKEVLYYSALLNEKESFETYQQQKDYLSKVQKQSSLISIRLGKMQKVKVKLNTTWAKQMEYLGQSLPYTWVQKGVDVKLTIDLLLKAQNNNYETAILLTGDSDFEEVIDCVKSLGKKLELITFERYDVKPCASLIEKATEHQEIKYQDGNKKFWKSVSRKPI